ncbi:hypothetical protein TGS27_1005 [Geobacillus stearothermophilus]|uniref:Uncharacterized protein n=1 Tax=Geobacillus stearothermophilus TaxID=1422 RepID=A0A150MG25_GEOSE|nr:hypothetical protein GS8_2630 [Geobacillus stearothermophilus]KYD23378.1 hypothetical protein B4109_2346 [Geobacillus stearothermophilus]KYD34279.1 hypothetical protein B4114_2383 [Geobacillus stearothermophilus]OAO83788.1 hypothetical protein TGS27_1005 [Geobacillus stearothermophilus]
MLAAVCSSSHSFLFSLLSILSVPRNGPFVNGQAGKEGNGWAAANHV